MSMLDRIRQKQGNTQPQPSQPAKVPTPKPKKKSEGSVTFPCGHVKPIAHLTAKPCPACREKQRQEQAKSKREADAVAKAERIQQAKGESWKAKAGRRLARLPDGSRYDDLVFEGKTKTWTGKLTIPGEWVKQKYDRDDGDLVFTGTAEAIFKLLSSLDEQYRKWLYERKLEKEEESV